MQNAATVGRRQPFENLGEQRERAGWGQLSVVRKRLAKCDSGHVFHHQEGGVAIGALVENVDQVWVAELGRHLRLLDEAVAERRVFCKVRVDDLDGDLAVEALIGGQINVGHAAAGEQTLNAIAIGYEGICQRQGGSFGAQTVL